MEGSINWVVSVFEFFSQRLFKFMEHPLLFLNVAQQAQNLLLLPLYLVNFEIPAYWLAANKQQGNHQKEKEE